MRRVSSASSTARSSTAAATSVGGMVAALANNRAPTCVAASASTPSSSSPSSSSAILATSMRCFVIPPPAPPAPNRFSVYGDEGRQDVHTSNAFIAKAAQAAGSEAERSLIGNNTDEDDLDGTMLQAPRLQSFNVKQRRPDAPIKDNTQHQNIRLPGVGGNSIPLDQLPRPPFEEYGRVLENLRQAVFRQAVKKKLGPNQNPDKANPHATAIVSVSLGKVMNDLPADIRRLLKNPIFSGLESTLRSCPAWFEVSQDSLLVRLTSNGHQWGTKTVTSTSIPVPSQIEQAMFIDQRQREDAINKQKERETIAEREAKKREEIRLGTYKFNEGVATFSIRKREKFANPFAPDTPSSAAEGGDSSSISAANTMAAIDNTMSAAIPNADTGPAAGAFMPRKRTPTAATGIEAVPPPPPPPAAVESAKKEEAAPAAPVSAFVPRKRPKASSPSPTPASATATDTAPTATPSVHTAAGVGVGEGTSGASAVNDSNSAATDNAAFDFSQFGSIPPPPPPSKGAKEESNGFSEFAGFGAIPPPPPPLGYVGGDFANFDAVPPPPPPSSAYNRLEEFTEEEKACMAEVEAEAMARQAEAEAEAAAQQQQQMGGAVNAAAGDAQQQQPAYSAESFSSLNVGKAAAAVNDTANGSPTSATPSSSQPPPLKLATYPFVPVEPFQARGVSFSSSSPSSPASSTLPPPPQTTPQATGQATHQHQQQGFTPRSRLVLDRTPTTPTPAPTADTPATAAPATPPAAPERRALLVSRSRYSAIGKIKASENIAFERLASSHSYTARDLAGPEFVAQGGTKKAILSKDSKVLGVVDLSEAPLSSEEVAMVPVMKLHSFLGGPFIPDPSIRKLPPPPTIFPPHVNVPTLPEFEFLDKIYTRYCRTVPSQMAFALFEFVPTFYVEVRMLYRLIPLNAMAAIFKQERKDRAGRLLFPISIFRKYSTMFELTGLGQGDRPAVRINWRGFPYLRNHPRFGMADNAMRRYSLERASLGGMVNAEGVVNPAMAPLPETPRQQGAGGVMTMTKQEEMRSSDRQGLMKEGKLDMQIFEILLSHLPRTTDQAKREAFVSLVPWINSFPPEELEVLNQVPQERVIRIILKYSRIFQLGSSTDDPNLFSLSHAKTALERSKAFSGQGAVKGGAIAPQMGDVSAMEATGIQALSEMERLATKRDEEELQFEDDDAVLDVHTQVQDEDAPARLHEFSEGNAELEAEAEEGDDEHHSSMGDSTAAADGTDSLESTPSSPSGKDLKSLAGEEGEGLVSRAVAAEAIAKASKAMKEELGVTSMEVIVKNSELSDAEKGRVKAFNASLEEGLIGMEDILLKTDANNSDAANPSSNGSQGGELMDKGEAAEVYGEDELAANEDTSSETVDDNGDDVVGTDSSDKAANDRHRKPARSLQQIKDDEEAFGFTTDFDNLLIRRLPRTIAPRSLCDCDEASSPDPKLIRTIMKYIPSNKRNMLSVEIQQNVLTSSGKLLIPAAPVAVVADEGEDGDTSTAFKRLWRWVPLETIYSHLHADEKRALRPYRGLANFIRLHGKLCEVSEDSRYVIAHAPHEVPPLIPTLRFFSVEERLFLPKRYDEDLAIPTKKVFDDLSMERDAYDRVIGTSQIPTTRVALQLMDPRNPILDSDILAEEVANFLPDHPVPVKTALRKLPPLLRAALPVHHLRGLTRSARSLTVIQRGPVVYIMKASLGEVVNADVSHTVATLEETLDAVKKAINLHGTTKIHIWGRLSFGPRNYIKRHYENIGVFILGFPKIFYTENHVIEIRRESQKDVVKRLRQLVHLVSNIEAREEERRKNAMAGMIDDELHP